MRSLEGKSALVTGASRGIGLAIARALADRGASVTMCSRSEGDIVRAASELSIPKGQPGQKGQTGQRILAAVADVRDENQVEDLFRKVSEESGGLDILVNNAGVGLRRAVAETTPEEWRAVIETNLSGVFYCCRHAIPMMKERGGGYIINVGSLAGKNAFPGAAAYCASKYGLIGFSEALMQEVRYDHIRVSYVMPGSVSTGFGGRGEEGSDWKLTAEDVATAVMNLLDMNPRALASRVELRPSEPAK